MRKERIDKLIVESGFSDSLIKAQALIMSGIVLVNEQRVEKPSELFSSEAIIRIKGEAEKHKYVGRGGLKLERALKEFHIQPNGYVCLDVGASTGGFTDCLLQNGAKKVISVDAGTNQIVWKLRNDERVEVRENTNARNLKPEDFDEKFDLIVMDVSFISVTKIFSALLPLLKDKGKIITLVKPQFEVKKGEVGKGGIVRETEKHKEVLLRVNQAAEQIGLNVLDVIESPILGADGNKEFLVLYEKRKENRIC
ncbi:MAG TPA: TlyA family RNA methyltransferase [Pyrinomonadaceae bacterium]|nr:TlyA family RNA methyltransferase [Pyrinomonadaceae bacterium]